jgi:hypothetical protein
MRRGLQEFIWISQPVISKAMSAAIPSKSPNTNCIPLRLLVADGWHLGNSMKVPNVDHFPGSDWRKIPFYLGTSDHRCEITGVKSQV